MLHGVGALAKPFVKQMQNEMAHQKRAQQQRRPRETMVCIPLPRKQKCRRRVDPRICHRLQRAQAPVRSSSMKCETVNGKTRCTVNGREVAPHHAAAVAEHMEDQMNRKMRDMDRE